jgi:acyl carrier protein
MTQNQIAQQLKAYLADSFLDPSHAAALKTSDDLFSCLDSLQILRMVVQLEALFGVRVDDSELTAENLGTIDRVASFVVSKLDTCAETAVVLTSSPHS